MKNWKETFLKNVSDLITKGTTPTSVGGNFSNAGINFIKSESLNYQGILDETKFAFVDEETNKKLKRSILKENDILYSIAGIYLGKIGIVKNQHLPANTNQACAIIRLKHNEVDYRFIKQYFSEKSFINYINGLTGQAAQPNINLTDIGNLKLLLPPLHIQQRIASILSAYDALIEVNNQRIKLLEETASQLYKEWFVRMRFPGYKKTKFIKGIPEGWEMKKLKECCGFKYGTMPKQELIKDAGFPIFSGYGIVGFYEKYMFEDKTLIVVARGVGGTGDIKLTPLKCWLTNLAIAIFPDNINLLKYFLYYTLSAIDLRYLDSGSAQSQITIADLGNLKLLIPDIQLQRKFEKIIIPLENQIENLQQQNTQLRQIRDRLLPRLISGKLQLKNYEQEIPLPLAAEDQGEYNTKL